MSTSSNDVDAKARPFKSQCMMGAVNPKRNDCSINKIHMTIEKEQQFIFIDKSIRYSRLNRKNYSFKNTIGSDAYTFYSILSDWNGIGFFNSIVAKNSSIITARITKVLNKGFFIQFSNIVNNQADGNLVNSAY